MLAESQWIFDEDASIEAAWEVFDGDGIWHKEGVREGVGLCIIDGEGEGDEEDDW